MELISLSLIFFDINFMFELLDFVFNGKFLFLELSFFVIKGSFFLCNFFPVLNLETEIKLHIEFGLLFDNLFNIFVIDVHLKLEISQWRVISGTAAGVVSRHFAFGLEHLTFLFFLFF